MTSDEYTEAMKWEVIGQGLGIFNIVTSKAAVAFLLLRIVEQTWHKMYIWFCIVTNSLLASWCTLAIFVQCMPVHKVWDPMHDGECWLDFTKVGLVTSCK